MRWPAWILTCAAFVLAVELCIALKPQLAGCRFYYSLLGAVTVVRCLR